MDTSVDVFVSYRRQDDPGRAGRLRDALVAKFGAHHVFYDLSSVQGGANFAAVIEQAIAQSTVVLAVIGPRWARIGRSRRWFGGRDWVSIELEKAGKSGKPVLPVLVGGASTSILSALTTDLSYLASINAFALRDESWDVDVKNLIERLPSVTADYAVPHDEPAGRTLRPLWVATFGLLAIASALWTLSWIPRRNENLDALTRTPVRTVQEPTPRGTAPNIPTASQPAGAVSPSPREPAQSGAAAEGSVGVSPAAVIQNDSGSVLVQSILLNSPRFRPGDEVKVKIRTLSSRVSAFAVFDTATGPKKVQAKYNVREGGTYIPYVLPSNVAIGRHRVEVFVQRFGGTEEERQVIEFDVVK